MTLQQNISGWFALSAGAHHSRSCLVCKSHFFCLCFLQKNLKQEKNDCLATHNIQNGQAATGAETKLFQREALFVSEKEDVDILVVAKWNLGRNLSKFLFFKPHCFHQHTVHVSPSYYFFPSAFVMLTSLTPSVNVVAAEQNPFSCYVWHPKCLPKTTHGSSLFVFFCNTFHFVWGLLKFSNQTQPKKKKTYVATCHNAEEWKREREKETDA